MPESSAPELTQPLPDLLAMAIQQVLKQYGLPREAVLGPSRPIFNTLAEFREYLADERDRKLSTLDIYCSDVKLFAVFVEKTASRPAETSDLTRENFCSFVASERRAGRASSSVTRRAHGLRAYWLFLAKRNLSLPAPSFEEMDLRFKRVQTHQRVLTHKEFLRLCTLPLEPLSPCS
jgi:site-specific recombinase XerD